MCNLCWNQDKHLNKRDRLENHWGKCVMQVWGSLKQKCERKWKSRNEKLYLEILEKSFAKVFCFITGCSPEKKTLVILYVWKPVAPQSKKVNKKLTATLYLTIMALIVYNLQYYLYISLCDFKSHNNNFVSHNCYFITDFIIKKKFSAMLYLIIMALLVTL